MLVSATLLKWSESEQRDFWNGGGGLITLWASCLGTPGYYLISSVSPSSLGPASE